MQGLIESRYSSSSSRAGTVGSRCPQRWEGGERVSRVAEDQVPFSSDVPSSSYALSPLRQALSLALGSLILCMEPGTALLRTCLTMGRKLPPARHPFEKVGGGERRRECGGTSTLIETSKLLKNCPGKGRGPQAAVLGSLRAGVAKPGPGCVPWWGPGLAGCGVWARDSGSGRLSHGCCCPLLGKGPLAFSLNRPPHGSWSEGPRPRSHTRTRTLICTLTRLLHP